MAATYLGQVASVESGSSTYEAVLTDDVAVGTVLLAGVAGFDGTDPRGGVWGANDPGGNTWDTSAWTGYSGGTSAIVACTVTTPLTLGQKVTFVPPDGSSIFAFTCIIDAFTGIDTSGVLATADDTGYRTGHFQTGMFTATGFAYCVADITNPDSVLTFDSGWIQTSTARSSNNHQAWGAYRLVDGAPVSAGGSLSPSSGRSVSVAAFALATAPPTGITPADLSVSVVTTRPTVTAPPIPPTGIIPEPVTVSVAATRPDVTAPYIPPTTITPANLTVATTTTRPAVTAPTLGVPTITPADLGVATITTRPAVTHASQLAPVPLTTSVTVTRPSVTAPTPTIPTITPDSLTVRVITSRPDVGITQPARNLILSDTGPVTTWVDTRPATYWTDAGPATHWTDAEPATHWTDTLIGRG